MSNPVEEYFELRKEAGFLSGLWKGVSGGAGATAVERGAQLGGDLRQGAMQTAMTVGAALAIPAAQKVVGALRKRHDYNKMMDHDPSLHDLKEQDPKFFNQSFTSLRRANPSFGSDPMISSSYMHKMVGNREGAGLAVAEAMQQRRPAHELSLGVKPEGSPFSPSMKRKY